MDATARTRLFQTANLCALGFAAGALLGAAFLLLTPEAVIYLNQADPATMMTTFGTLATAGVFGGALLSWLAKVLHLYKHKVLHRAASAAPARGPEDGEDSRLESKLGPLERMKPIVPFSASPLGASPPALEAPDAASSRASSPRPHPHCVPGDDEADPESVGVRLDRISISGRGSPALPMSPGSEAAAEAATATDRARAGRARSDLGVILPVLVGDFIHNAVDGVLIGVAAQICGVSSMWVVATGAVAHELAQELADYIILVTRGRLSVLKALGLNWLSSLSCPLFAGIFASLTLSPQALGSMLAFSAGLYLYLGMAICLAPIIETNAVGPQLLAFVAFALGAVAIGLVLLDHQHCEL